MNKQNLVIIHSFPSNSLLLQGLYTFLSDFFTVYPIDLPGFISQKKRLKKISFEGYVNHIQKELNTLSLDSYILGGVSFGFSVVNGCQVDDRCKGFLALAPFINRHYIRDDTYSYDFLKKLLRFVTTLRLHKPVYHARYFKRFLHKQAPPKHVRLMQENIDPYTFFETAKMLIKYRKEPVFHNKPYVLVINEEDTTISAPKTIKLFEKLDNVLIVKTTSEHHPGEISKEYFKQHIKPSDIMQLVHFLESQSSLANC
ncbi:MAG: hypothetical protein AAF335_00040 [Bacteroidota bacterium]